MKTVTVLCSNRGDIDLLTLHLEPDETLREALRKENISHFATASVDPDDSSQVEDGMSIYIRIFD